MALCGELALVEDKNLLKMVWTVNSITEKYVAVCVEGNK